MLEADNREVAAVQSGRRFVRIYDAGMSERGEIRPDAGQEPLGRLEDARRADLRRRYLETTVAERLETCVELSELAHDLRHAVSRAR